MTQEERELLLKDLSARLPYGVKIHNPHPRFPNPDEYIQTLTDIHGTMQYAWITFGTDNEEINVNWNIGNKEEDVPKPYLRSLTSLTKEEKEYVEELSNFRATPDIVQAKVDFYMEHFINYRLPDNLFIEAPKDMYNIKN